MLRARTKSSTSIVNDFARKGETIEEKVRRIVSNKSPITDGAPIVYQRRDEGVQAGFNIRTDRHEVAIDAMDAVSRSRIAMRTAFKKKDDQEGVKPSAEGTKD